MAHSQTPERSVVAAASLSRWPIVLPAYVGE